MSTHYIEEAERLCDSVTIMSHGSAVATGSPRDLVHEHAGAEAVEVYGPPAKLAEVEREARDGGPEDAPHGHVRERPRRQRQRARRASAARPTSRTSSCS